MDECIHLYYKIKNIARKYLVTTRNVLSMEKYSAWNMISKYDKFVKHDEKWRVKNNIILIWNTYIQGHAISEKYIYLLDILKST